MSSDNGFLFRSFSQPDEPLATRRVAAEHGRNLACWTVAGFAITMLRNAKLDHQAIKELDLEAEKFDEVVNSIGINLPTTIEGVRSERAVAEQAYRDTLNVFRNFLVGLG